MRGLAFGFVFLVSLKMSEFNYVILSMVLWNIITFIIYGVDKRNAIYGKQRISEKALFICAFMMGGMGALFGMRFFTIWKKMSAVFNRFLVSIKEFSYKLTSHFICTSDGFIFPDFTNVSRL